MVEMIEKLIKVEGGSCSWGSRIPPGVPMPMSVNDDNSDSHVSISKQVAHSEALKCCCSRIWRRQGYEEQGTGK